jgi:hypothetical protein
LLFREEEKEDEVVGVVVGMEYFGVSCVRGDASFSVFSGLGVGGDVFCVPSGCGDASFSVFSG